MFFVDDRFSMRTVVVGNLSPLDLSGIPFVNRTQETNETVRTIGQRVLFHDQDEASFFLRH